VVDARTVAALDAYTKLMGASRAMAARAGPLLTTASLTPTQYGVLAAILHNGPLSQRELSRKVLTSAGNMTDPVDKLEARGLVRRIRQELDRRAVRVELTQMGRGLIGPLYVSHAAELAAAMAGLSSDELRQRGELLRRLELTVAA
jgi:MarR family transcriptional regulator, 2-MHQ and catechol-resistance regulon repressor